MALVHNPAMDTILMILGDEDIVDLSKIPLVACDLKMGRKAFVVRTIPK